MEAAAEFWRSFPLGLYAAAILAVVSYVLLPLFIPHRRYSLPLPPGPWGVPLLGYLPFLDPDLHFHLAKLAAVHGPVFSLQLCRKLIVVVSSAAAAREILRDQDVTFANRDVQVASHIITYGASDVAWSPYGPMWRMLRKVCVRNLLSGQALDAFYGLRRREVRAMARRTAQRARSGGEVDVGKEAFLTVIGVISSMLWGAGEGAQIVNAEFKDLVHEILVLLGTPNVSDLFPLLRRFDLQGIEKKVSALLERFDGMFQRVISVRERSHGSGAGAIEAGGFLEVLLRLEEEGGGDGKTPFTRNHTKAILMDIVTAGTDTTSNTLEFAMAEMMNRPETMRKAQAELDLLVGRNTVVEESVAVKLPYLTAVIKETLRLHPPGPLLLPRCPSVDCVVDGYTVPAGTRVFVNAWAIHHDPATWEDPSTFNPERFLGDEAADRVDFSGNDLTYIPFGSGRRICVGSGMGERTLVYVLAALLHAFDWQLPDGVREVNIEERFGLVVKMKRPLVLIPKLRLSEPQLYQ